MKHSRFAVWVAALACSTCFPVALAVQDNARALDFYPGTVALQQGELILRRCDLAQNTYVLVDPQGQQASLLAQLPQQVRDAATPVSVNIIAGYEAREGRNYLYVAELQDIQVGSSCHLLDSLDGLLPANQVPAETPI